MLVALGLVSFGTIGFEIVLTRYFAVAKWSEYGYWVISIVLAGFAASGVVMALARNWFAARGERLMAWLPAVLVAAAAIGAHFVTTNPFNPLQLQNPATLWPQIANIAAYYAALLPLFFFAGLFVSLAFVLGGPRLGRVYGFDLAGAGSGAIATLALMWIVHPFRLSACLLLPFALAAVPFRRHHASALAAALILLAAGEALLLLGDQAAFNDYKAIYAPLHVPNSQTLATIPTPRGLYMILDDFTERVDTDISNDAANLGLPGPPRTLGVYRDGNRIGALPRPGHTAGAAYAGATLAGLPYALLAPHPDVLLIGASGGYRVAEARALGARRIIASEPEPLLRRATSDGLAGTSRLPAETARVTEANPLAIVRSGAHFDLIDIAGDFLDAAEANTGAFTAEAIASDLVATAPAGMVSIPVSIREFPAYVTRMLRTVRAALLRAGVADPARHVLVYRSAWNVRVLASLGPLDAARIAAARRWCDERSFDVSYYPGIDVEAARANIYNDLPAVSFASGTVTSGDSARDAVADEAGPVLAGRSVSSDASFDLSPITLDRPAFYNVLRLAAPGTLFARLELLPQAEIGGVVNLAVLTQAAIIAAAVLLVPLLARRRVGAAATGVLRPACYFAALGVGYLFIEIAAIDRASLYLNDRTSGFALVLACMLVASGIGAFLADRVPRPAHGSAVRIAAACTIGWCVLAVAWLTPCLLATLSWPWWTRAALVIVTITPVSVALGFPFPLGLGAVGAGGFLPWAWGLNGAFSVVATPLANIIALKHGDHAVLFGAAVLYAVALVSFPRLRVKKCQLVSEASRVAVS